MNRYFLGFAEERYSHLEDLHGTPNDLKAMNAQFESLGFEVLSGKGLNPSPHAIRDAFKDALKKTKQGDLLVFWFGGHAAREMGSGDGLLLGPEAEKGDLTDHTGRQFVRVSELQDDIAAQHTAGIHLLFVIDACRTIPNVNASSASPPNRAAGHAAASPATGSSPPRRGRRDGVAQPLRPLASHVVTTLWSTRPGHPAHELPGALPEESRGLFCATFEQIVRERQQAGWRVVLDERFFRDLDLEMLIAASEKILQQDIATRVSRIQHEQDWQRPVLTSNNPPPMLAAGNPLPPLVTVDLGDDQVEILRLYGEGAFVRDADGSIVAMRHLANNIGDVTRVVSKGERERSQFEQWLDSTGLRYYRDPSDTLILISRDRSAQCVAIGVLEYWAGGQIKRVFLYRHALLYLGRQCEQTWPRTRSNPPEYGQNDRIMLRYLEAENPETLDVSRHAFSLAHQPATGQVFARALGSAPVQRQDHGKADAFPLGVSPERIAEGPGRPPCTVSTGALSLEIRSLDSGSKRPQAGASAPPRSPGMLIRRLTDGSDDSYVTCSGELRLGATQDENVNVPCPDWEQLGLDTLQLQPSDGELVVCLKGITRLNINGRRIPGGLVGTDLRLPLSLSSRVEWLNQSGEMVARLRSGNARETMDRARTF